MYVEIVSLPPQSWSVRHIFVTDCRKLTRRSRRSNSLQWHNSCTKLVQKLKWVKLTHVHTQISHFPLFRKESRLRIRFLPRRGTHCFSVAATEQLLPCREIELFVVKIIRNSLWETELWALKQTVYVVTTLLRRIKREHTKSSQSTGLMSFAVVYYIV